MSEVRERGGAAPGRIGRVTLAAAVLVVLLAAGAVLWPRDAGLRGNVPVVLVFDPARDLARLEDGFMPLTERLSTACGRGLRLVGAGDLADFRRELARKPVFVVVPDGLALELEPADYVPLASGRRPAPMNLRPTGVLVSRRGVPAEAEPWRTRTARTVCGDSLSLAATGALRAAGLTRWPSNLACGPDPYDHGPALHALRLGAFDYALVRNRDLERFEARGLLDAADLEVRELVGPVPDLVVMVSRRLARHERLRCGEMLGEVGRVPQGETPGADALATALGRLHLAGFNVLLESDFAGTRKKFAGSWLPASD